MRRRRGRIVAAAAGLAITLVPASPAAAKLAFNPKSLKDKFDVCREKFGASPESAAIVNQLESSDKFTHTITSTNNDVSSAEPIIKPNALLGADGKPGRGTGSTVRWNSGKTKPYADGTPTDPCASLLHELKHSLDFQNGTANPRPFNNSKVVVAEIDASREENRYRKKAGLPQRTKYDEVALPSDAMFKPLVPSGFDRPALRSAARPSAVRLTARPTKATFGSGADVAIALRLVNRGGRALSLTRQTLGSVRIESVARNGSRASRHRTVTYTNEDLRDSAFLALERVGAGKALTVRLETGFDAALGGPALQEATPGDDGNNAVRSFSLARPGHYAVELAYRYPLAAPGGRSVFAGRTASVVVIFRIA